MVSDPSAKRFQFKPVTSNDSRKDLAASVTALCLPLLILAPMVVSIGSTLLAPYSAYAQSAKRIGFSHYWLGMSHDEFDHSPVPTSWSDYQNIVPRISENFNSATNSITGSFGGLAYQPPYDRGSPSFLFFKDQSSPNFKLIAIYGNVKVTEVELIAQTLKASLGTPKIWSPLNIHGQFDYEWQFGSYQIKLKPFGGPFAKLEFIDSIGFSKYNGLNQQVATEKVKREEEEVVVKQQESEKELQQARTATELRKVESAPLISQWIDAAEGRGNRDTAAYSVDAKFSKMIRDLPKNTYKFDWRQGQKAHDDGIQKLKSGNYDEALRLLSEAYESNPISGENAADLALAERLSGKLDLAKKHYFDSISLGAKDNVWLELGSIFAMNGDRSKAVTCFLIANRHSGGNGIDSIKDDTAIGVHEAYLQAMSIIWPSQDYGKQLASYRPTNGTQGIVGISFATRRGGLPEVTAVIPGYGGDSAGIVVGDQIVAVDGRPAKDLDSDALKSLIGGPAGSTVQISLSNGRTVNCVRKRHP